MNEWIETKKVIAITIVAANVGLALMWTIYQPVLTPGAKDVLMLITGGLVSALGATVQSIFQKD